MFFLRLQSLDVVNRWSMRSLKTLCRPQPLFSFISCRQLFRTRVSFRIPNFKPPSTSPSLLHSSWLDPPGGPRIELGFRGSQRRTLVMASNWTHQKSPYQTLGNYYLFLSFFSLIQKMNSYCYSISTDQFCCAFCILLPPVLNISPSWLFFRDVKVTK